MPRADSEETIMEQDQQKPDHLPDRPRHTEDQLGNEKKQAEMPGSQDECQNLIHERQSHQIELEIEKEDLKKTLSVLEAKVGLYAALFDFAPVGYFFLERSGTISEVNRSGGRLLGIERVELIRRRFQSFVSDDFRNAFNVFLDKVLESRVTESCELMFRKEGGHLFHAHIEANASEDGQEYLVRVVDITDIKKTEESLKQSESLLKEAQHLAHIGHWVIDPATGASVWSEEVFRIFGLDPGQEAPSLAARRELIHPDDIDNFDNAISKSISDGVSFDIVCRLIRPDKSIRWVNTKGHADRNDEDQVVRLFGTVQDITELMQIEEKLTKSEAQLKETHRLAHIGIWDWTAETDTVTWSEELYDIAGRDPQLPAPSYAEHPNIYTPDSWNRLKAAVERSLETCESYQLELELVRPDGSTRWVNAFGGVKYDGIGRVIGLHGTVQDITERKVLEMELAVYHQELEELVKARTAELEEVNTALKVLINHREADKNQLQEKILSNVNELIIPYLEKIKISPLNPTQKAYMDIVETNLRSIIAPFLNHKTAKHYNLTPQEIQIAALIKSGRSSKDIASILNTSIKTINFHRGNIRRKLGLANKKANLRSNLLFIA
jgi:PAS domain S-box-containing protein